MLSDLSAEDLDGVDVVLPVDLRLQELGHVDQHGDEQHGHYVEPRLPAGAVLGLVVKLCLKYNISITTCPIT